MVAGDKRPGQVKLGSNKSRQEGKSAINQHEKDLAKTVGGIRQPQSGAMPHHKGDVLVDDGIFSINRFLFDSKETNNSSIMVSGNDLTKICREAMGEDKEPGLLLTIHKTPPHTPSEWAAVPLEVFVSMLERIRYYESQNQFRATDQSGDGTGDS